MAGFIWFTLGMGISGILFLLVAQALHSNYEKAKQEMWAMLEDLETTLTYLQKSRTNRNKQNT